MITYPVTSDQRFAVLRVSTNTVLRRNVPWPRADGQPVPDLDPDLRLLEMVRAAEPAFDPLTQKLDRVETIEAANERLVLGWQVVALSAAEQAEVNEREVIRAAYQDLKNGTGTQLERLVRVEKAAAWLLRQVAQ